MNKENIFCNLSDLRNESDVEQFFMIRLLKSLGYKDKNIHTKETITVKKIGKGRDKKDYKPDYLIYVEKYPIIAIDVKNPKSDPKEGLRDALMYAREINGEYVGKNPIKFCIGSNGAITELCKWDENKAFLSLNFNDFQLENKKYNELVTILSYKELKSKKIEEITTRIILIKPEIGKIKGIFRACHNQIWNNEKSSPSFAFYEFVKLMFIKLDEDKKLHQNKELKERIETRLPIPEKEITFSLRWIEKEEKHDSNPVDSILFKNLKKKLENEIIERKKKRIFDKNEHIRLKPSTIKNVVELLENLDLYGIDEDLNGRLFETFLTATMRGKELGQFFTPRTVVKFMTKIADIRADKKHIDKVLDGCCGTGGFLIEVMADMCNKIEKNKSLSNIEQDDIIKKIKNECIYGIDVGKDPPIARIARINMYLHKDGGSRIYQLDTLDKDIVIEEGLDDELKRNMSEFKGKVLNENLKFNVILTNPPFAMKYSKAKKSKKREEEKEKKKAIEQERILKQYLLAEKRLNLEKDDLPEREKPDSKEIRSSLRSSVMFLERYYELLKPHGKLLTIMDEGVLNTQTNKRFRDYIKKRFIIKAVIALPHNTFVNADSGVKTSVLYLIKKKETDEKQPEVFMAISENVGHNDVGKPTPELNDLDNIRKI